MSTQIVPVELSVPPHLLTPAPARHEVCEYTGPDVAVGTLSAGPAKKNTLIRAGTRVRVCENQYIEIPDAHALVRVHASLVHRNPVCAPSITTEPAQCTCEHMRIANKTHEKCVCM